MNTMDLKNEDLLWQGLDKEKYARLDPTAKEFVEKRAKSMKQMRAIALVGHTVVLIKNELGTDADRILTPILTGEDASGAAAIRSIVADYLTTGRGMDLREFYKRKYAGKAREILAQPSSGEANIIKKTALREKKILSQIGGSKTSATTNMPALEKQIAASKTRKITPMIQPHVEGLSYKDRVVELALLISQWEKISPEKAIKTERDLIDKIIKIADENREKGITDADICLAAENIVSDEFHEAQFHLEALHENHREELIKRALKIKSQRGG